MPLTLTCVSSNSPCPFTRLRDPCQQRIVGRLEVANAQRAEERRKMEERLSSADLLNLLEDFGRRIRDLESRNAESGAVSAT